MQAAKEILKHYRANIIAEMLEARGEKLLTRKTDNLAYLATLIGQKGQIVRTLEALNEQEELLLALLLEHNGRMSYQRLQRILTTRSHNFAQTRYTGTIAYIDGQRTNLPEVNPYYKQIPSLEDAVAGLTLKGLVFSQDPLTDSRVLDWLYGQIIFIPEFVRRHIDQADLPEPPQKRVTEPRHIVSGSAQRFQRNLSRYARFLRRRGELKFTTQGQLYKNDLRELADEVSFMVDTRSGKKELDNGQLYFMRRLIPKVGLAEPQKYTANDPLIATENPHLLRLPLAERVRECFIAWRDEGLWHELAQLPTYQNGINLEYPAHKEFVRTRNLVLEHISAQPGEWVDLVSVVDDIRDEDYGFLFPNRTFRSYYGRTPETPYLGRNNRYNANFRSISSEASGWNIVEVDLINHIIAGPLFWLGLVDLGYMKEPPVDLKGNKRIDGFRLTAYGRWLIKNEPLPESAPAAAGNLIIQPNFEIMTMGPVGDETLMTLDLFAKSKQEQEHVSVYALERDSVYQAQKVGWPVARIIDFLERLSSKPLPQNVRRSLEEWGALQDRIVIRKGVRLLETADDMTAEQLTQEFAGDTLRRMMPTVFLSKQTADALAKQLDDARWIPLRTRPGNRTANNSVTIDPEGNIVFTQPTPSLYARNILHPISAESGRGRVLTRPLVNAVVNDIGLGRLIMYLQQIHKGQLPTKLINKLKAWTGYYGNAQTATVTLIEFESERVRDELVHDEELRDYLTIFPASGRALAAIHPEFVQQVKAVLQEREIEIGEGLD